MANKINIGTEINLEELLQSRLLIQANSGGGKSVLARVIIEETFGKVPFIVMDIEGEYYTLKEKYGDILVIGGQHGDISISLKSVKLLPKEIIANRLSVVVDLSDLQMNERILYSKQFIESMMDLPKQYWINYLVFIEEAHKLCGEQDKQASATAVKDLMSRGRKRGYCGILLTQRISKLHKDAAAECNNKFIGRTYLDIDLDRAAKELGISSATEKLKIRDLQPGNFFAFGTSIFPHHVHEVKIKEPRTKIPKAGVDLNIKPKAPTEKIKSMLAKLNDLPAEAEKEVKTIQELQKEVTRLKSELNRNGNHRLIEKLKAEKESYRNMLNTSIAASKALEEDHRRLKKFLVRQTVDIKKILEREIEWSYFKDFELLKDEPIQHKPVTNLPQNVPNVQRTVTKASNNGQLGKCSFAILQFLASFPERSWSKPQVGIATGYSPNSGGFGNALSELNTKGLIIRDDGKLRVNETESTLWTILGPDFRPQKYSVETFKSKLGKCEREIYEVLLDRPNDIFSKEALAAATPSGYSSSSGGFNSSLSTLSTLELIRRDKGSIRLNPELLEI